MAENLQNVKADAWNKFLLEKQIQAFTVEQADDELKSVVFRSTIEVNGQKLPTILIIDNSIYSVIRIQIATNVINDKNHAAISELINEYNMKYKAFKYYTSDNGDLGLDSCLVFTEDNFEPELIRAILQVILQHLEVEYPNMMRRIWS